MESSKAIANSIPLVSPSAPNTSNFSFHYSFDFAQQVLFPSNPLQPGPIYFLVPHRSQIFGIQAEGVQKQVNYIMDESVNFGKGPNVVISFLHHFLNTMVMGRKQLCYTVTIVQVRTKIIMYSGISHGGVLWDFIVLFSCHF